MRSPRLRRTAAILTGILGLTFADRSSAEYLLAPGDVLEITALGMPDLKQSTTIDVDGQAYFPVLGQMKAAGMSLPELRNKVHEAKEKEGAQAEAKDLDEMRQNFAKGVIPVMRLSEVRRLSLLSATQALQTTALLATVERQQGELKRRLRWTDGKWQIDLTRELQEAQVRLETIRVRIQAVGEKLEYAGLVRSQLVRGRGGEPNVRVFRNQSQARQSLTADEDTELLPGDVVEVALRMEGLAGGAGVAP
jgi:protein involved in polysaccharide export with SLBB domain